MQNHLDASYKHLFRGQMIHSGNLQIQGTFSPLSSVLSDTAHKEVGYVIYLEAAVKTRAH